jgi:hypothetical protein
LFYIVFNDCFPLKLSNSLSEPGTADKHFVCNLPVAVQVPEAGIWAGLPRPLLALARGLYAHHQQLVSGGTQAAREGSVRAITE